MTKHQRQMWRQFQRATATELREVYKNWSTEKQRAYDRCKDIAIANNADRYRICSATSNFFTFAFSYPDPITGQTRLQFRTGRNVYDFAVEDETIC